MMPKYLLVTILMIYYSFAAQAQQSEELVIFVDSNQNSAYVLNDMQILAQSMREKAIPTTIINIHKKGAPPEVAYTPCIIYRNHLGNKLYKGRHSTHQRILNFIRTTRRLKIEPIDYEESNVFVWKREHSNLLFKLKVTDLEGSLPDNFSTKKFKKEYLKGLKKGFESAQYSISQKVSDKDELFYCNFYPYRSNNGDYHVSTEIYAHYDCKKPIYTQFKQAIKSAKLCAAFDTAAAILQKEIKKQLIYSKKGDAMYFVKKDKNPVSWSALGLAKLSAPAKSTQKVLKDVQMPTSWMLDGPSESNNPLLSFNFPPPLRQYGGEIKKCSGRIEMPNKNMLKDMKGNFTAYVTSIDMGESSLTSAVKTSMLYTDKYPTATLTFKSVNSDDLNLQLGKITSCEVIAELTMMEKTSTVSAISAFEPVLDENGAVLLLVSTNFEVKDLTGMYDIIGPDGPETSNNRMLFSANFKMKAADMAN